MKIGLSTVTISITGAFILNANLSASAITAFTRRTNKVRTLDGGVVVTDFGYSAGDRNFVIETDPLEDALTLENIRQAVKTSGEFILCLPEGAWKVNATDFDFTNKGSANIKFTAIASA